MTWSSDRRRVLVADGPQVLRAFDIEELPATPGSRTVLRVATDKRPLEVDPERIAAAEEEARRRGFATGRAEGFDAGFAEGRTAASATLASVAEALTQAAGLLRRAADEAASTTEDRLARAAFDLARSILARELAVAADPGLDAVARALAIAPEGDAVLHLHPGDAAVIADVDLGPGITVVADPAVAVGGCVARIGASTIDASLEGAVERARQVLAP